MDAYSDTPEYIHYISTFKEAKRITEHLLCLEIPLCLPVILKRAGVTESKVSLLGLHMHGKYYIFDLRDVSKFFIKSGLFRLLLTPALVKVTHDNSDDLQQLMEHRITVNSIFDTQKAYDRVAHWNSMPTRKISIPTLHGKLNAITWELNIEEAELDAAIRCPVFADRTGMDWGRRPVSTAMLLQLSAELAALRQCYFGLRCIGERYDSLETLRKAEMGGEARERAVLAVGNFAMMQNTEEAQAEWREASEDSRKMALCVGIHRHLLSMGQSVLDGTMPIAEFRLVPYCRWNN